MARYFLQPSAMLSVVAILLAFNLGAVNAQNDPVPDTFDAEAVEDETLVVYPDAEFAADDSTADEPTAEDREALQRRAGEQVGDDPRGRAAVLGMYVQEADRQRVKVIEVAAASPAFEAGIRKGDVIVSFDGFKADTYRRWVNGIRSLVNDAPEGDTMPIQLLREGKTINLRLRKPAAMADDIPRESEHPLNQQLIQQDPGQQAPQQQAQRIVPSGGVGGAFFGGLDDFDDDRTDAIVESTARGVAEIFRLNAAAGQSDVVSPAAQGVNRQLRDDPRQAADAFDSDSTAEPIVTGNTVGGQRIGMAGLSNTSTGMLVTLDVSGLAPGSYLVGIDGSIGAGSVGTDQPQQPERRQSQLRAIDPNQPPAQQNPPIRMRVHQGPRQRSTTPRQQPAGGGAQPQGLNMRQLIAPATVLAQRLDLAQNTPAADTNATPAAEPPQQLPPTESAPGQTPPLDLPDPVVLPRTERLDTPTSDVPVPGSTQRNRNNVGDRRDRADDLQDANLGGTANGTGPGIGPAITVGMLTVDESGVGAMQQTVEGIQVGNVIGQSIVIYMQQVPATNSNLSPNANANVNRLRVAAKNRVPQSPQAGTGAQNLQATGQVPSRAESQQTPGVNQPNGSPTPIAAGVIRLASDQSSTTTPATPTQPSASLPEPAGELR
jgi:hypothetical protein